MPCNPGSVVVPDRCNMDMIATLTDLIAFDTTRPNSKLARIALARALVVVQGATTRMDWNADRTKANMRATFGEGPGDMKGYVAAALADNGPTLVELITDVATDVTPWEYISPGRG